MQQAIMNNLLLFLNAWSSKAEQKYWELRGKKSFSIFLNLSRLFFFSLIWWIWVLSCHNSVADSSSPSSEKENEPHSPVRSEVMDKSVGKSEWSRMDNWTEGILKKKKRKGYTRKEEERRNRKHTMRKIVQKTVHRARSNTVLLKCVYVSIFTWTRSIL